MTQLKEIYGEHKAGGQPTKYKKQYAQDILNYFLDSIVVEEVVDDPSGRGGTNTHFEVLRVPSLFGFAASIGVHRDTLYEWAKTTWPEGHKDAGKLRHPEFSDAFTHAQAIEKAVMFEYGSTGRLSNALVALYWTNHLDFKDSKHLDMTSDGERIQTTPVIVSAIAARQADDAPAEQEAS